METPLIDVLVEMESNGIAIDPAMLKEQSQVLGERIEELRKKIFEVGGRRVQSRFAEAAGGCAVQRVEAAVVKRTKTGASTDVEVLEKLAIKHPVPPARCWNIAVWSS